MAAGSKQIASPFSTGGGGYDLQSQVGAYYLAGLLLRHVPRGLDAGTLVEVRFQRLYQGEPVDDLICVAETAVGPSKLALQIKKDFTLTNSLRFPHASSPAPSSRQHPRNPPSPFALQLLADGEDDQAVRFTAPALRHQPLVDHDPGGQEAVPSCG